MTSSVTSTWFATQCVTRPAASWMGESDTWFQNGCPFARYETTVPDTLRPADIAAENAAIVERSVSGPISTLALRPRTCASV